jgi:hypothetical protein
VNALMKKTKIAIMFDETLRVKEVIKKWEWNMMKKKNVITTRKN